MRDLELDAHVSLVGFRNDLPDLLPGLDLLVHPAERVGLGVAVLEAMSAGVPVVASTAGGLTDLIDHEIHGLTFEPGDQSGLVKAMDRVLSEAELRARFRVAGRQRAQADFSVDRMSKQYLEVYNRVLTAPS